MPRKKIPINYTDRDFNSIKKSLIEHAKRYYPDSYRDFNEASFGSLFLDATSYVGDILSFYLDYQANESFFDTATEKDNVVSLARTMGYNYSDSIASYGICEFYAIVPINVHKTAPDLNYAPLLKEGTVLASTDGGRYSLIEDVDFSHSQNLVVVSSVDPNSGAPEKYAIKAFGQVKSGVIEEYFVDLGKFERFPKVTLQADNISEVISVEDSEGHRYYEVPHLSQDIIYTSVANRSTFKESVPNMIKPFSVPRRFVANSHPGFTELQFGQGSDLEILSGSYLDPSNVVMRQFGKFHISDTYLDPTNFTSTEKMGIAPANTTLSIKIRRDNVEKTNAPVGTIQSVVDRIVEFDNKRALEEDKMRDVRASIEVYNNEPIIGDLTTPDSEEVRIRTKNIFAAQDRAVTKQDYVSMIYAMPSKFGAVKRCSAVVDKDSFKRNINLHVLAENTSGYLVEANASLKNNVKKWINIYKMMGDTFDILDARIINLAIDYSMVIHPESNKVEAIAECNRVLTEYYRIPPQIGEPLYLNEIYNILNNLESVIDVTDVVVHNMVGGEYSDLSLDMRESLSIDGRVLSLPPDFIYEFKHPDKNFKGTVIS